MKRAFKSERHAALANSFPREPQGVAMTGPHRPRRKSRAVRYALLFLAALAVAVYRELAGA